MTGDDLRRIRLALDLSPAEMGAELGVSWRTIYRWERDEWPVSATAARLLRLLDPTGLRAPS